MNLRYHFKSIDFEGHIPENLNSYHKLKYLVTDLLPSCISGLLRKTFIDLIFQHSALRSRHCRSTCALPETEHEFIFSISVVTIAYTRDMAAGMGEYTHFSLQWHDILVFNIVSVKSCFLECLHFISLAIIVRHLGFTIGVWFWLKHPYYLQAGPATTPTTIPTITTPPPRPPSGSQGCHQQHTSTRRGQPPTPSTAQGGLNNKRSHQNPESKALNFSISKQAGIMLFVMLCAVCLIVLMFIMFVCSARVSNTQHCFYRNPHRAAGGQKISFARCYYGRSGQLVRAGDGF